MFGPELDTIGAYEGIHRHGRCTIRRRVTGAEDAYGQSTGDFEVVASDVPVRIRQTAAREAVDTERTAVVHDARAMFAPNQDVASGDHLTDITDDHGAAKLSGRWKVATVVDHVSHLEAMLESADG